MKKEFIDPAIPQALELLQTPFHADGESAMGRGLVPNQPGQQLLAEDIVESINNIAKEAFAAALADAGVAKVPSATKVVRKKSAKRLGATAKAAASGYADEAQKSVIKEAKRLGTETGPAITRWVKRLVFGSKVAGATGVAYGLAHLLIHAFPNKFQWLLQLMPFFS